MWTKDSVEKVLKENGWYSSQRSIQHGIQYTLTDGTPLDWYESSGKVVFRGKDSALKREVEKLFVDDPQTNGMPSRRSEKQSRVFVVYGHDNVARDELELIIRPLRLEPVILNNMPVSGDTIIEKLECLTAADFACVLLTPDDEGCKRGFRGELKARARQNVVLELGMVLAKLGRKHVAIFAKGNEIEKPSDIGGLIYIGYENSINEVKERLAACLQEAGFDIQVRDLIS
jgi:predicted nucleotide-binding protein